MEAINVYRLTGRLAEPPILDHVLRGEAFYSMRVAAKRLSGYEDMLPVTCSEQLLEGIEALQENDIVEISGQIRTYNRRGDTGSRLIITVFARELDFADEPAAFVNEAEIEGFVCKPVVYRLTPFGREIADILVAVPRRYNKCDHLPAIAWGRNARFAETLDVGARVRLCGRLQSRRYVKLLEDGSEEERTAYELSCTSIGRAEHGMSFPGR